ncbi:hypothetical protein EYR38_005078 [Pleurotus pulmonarius]|nr:hypothetical protein EYR38_005078 [Pleurotus pulmonarius]
MIPNHSPTLNPDIHSSRELSYEAEGNTLPHHVDNLAVAAPFYGANSEHNLAFREPALSLPAGIGARWNQVTGGGTIPQYVESIYPVVPFVSTINEDESFAREFCPSPTYPTWMETGQVTMNNVTAQDGEHATLYNEDMSNVIFEVPSSGIDTPVYPPWIAPELGQAAGWNHSTGMTRTSMPFNGAMGPAGYDHPLFPSFNDPQSAQGALNAMVVRPVVSTPATALEAERRRVHPRKFSCKFCPDGFTSKANRERELPSRFCFYHYIDAPCT